MPKYVKIVFFTVLAVFVTLGVVIYFTYYSPNSEASFAVCVNNKTCTNDKQCGGSGIGTCVRKSINRISINGSVTKRYVRLGKCVCTKPTSVPVVPTIKPSTYLWWYDSNQQVKEPSCQKIFLQVWQKENKTSNKKVFKSLKQCELDLFSRRPDIAEAECFKRGGEKVNSLSNKMGRKGNQYSFNIDRTYSCWTPILNCGFCNNVCMNMSLGQCPITVKKEGTSQAVNVQNSQGKPTPYKNICEDVLGRCYSEKTDTAVTPTLCPKPAVPSGCRLEIRKTLTTGHCPIYDVICDNENLPTDQSPVISPVANPPLSPTNIVNNPEEYCKIQGGTYRVIFTETEKEGWCMLGKRGCEATAFYNKECSL